MAEPVLAFRILFVSVASLTITLLYTCFLFSLTSTALRRLLA